MRRSFRQDSGGRLSLILVALLSAVSVVAVVLVLGFIVNPSMNKCDESQAFGWGQGFGTYAISQFGGRDDGAFERLDVQLTVDKPEVAGLPSAFLGFGEEHGDAHVEVSVFGPGDVNVYKWKSAATHMDFSTIDLGTGGKKVADFNTGLVCYTEHGSSTWTFVLIWESGSGPAELARETRTIEV